MFKNSTSLLYALLVTCILSLLPVVAAGAPQQADITKPTRERVNKNKKDGDKNQSKDAASNKDSEKKKNTATDNKKNTAADNKNVATKPAEKPATKPAEKTTAKPAEKKDDKPAVKQEANAPANDTSKKADAPVAPKKVPMDPNVVQFDGIDISKHQGTINWADLKKYTKIKFVYIKATEGSDYVDPRYKENIRNARKHGFKVGSYHFLSTKSSATTQFHNFIRTANREEQDLLPVIDIEVTGRWSSQQLRDSLKVFADLIEDYYGCKPLIYTSEKFFTKHLGRAFADYPLFIAKYSATSPNIGYKWILWQFSDCGQFKSAVRENRGEVDMSRFNKGYSINDILYVPGKHKPKNASVRDAVDHKEKPASVNLGEQKAKEAPKMSKRQQEEAQRQAEKEKKAKERNKKLAEDEAKKKADEAKKAKEKEERLKKEKARQKAREDAAKKEADEKAKKKAAQQAREEKARKEAAQKEADEKAKRKAAAQKAREEKAQKAATSKTNKSANLLQNSSTKMSQSQRNDSIRASKLKGRKTNKSSADND